MTHRAHRHAQQGPGIEVIAVYEFLSGDWSPWRAWATWRRKWPMLNFLLVPIYDVETSAQVAIAA